MHEANYPELTKAITQSLAPLRRSQEATMAGFGAMSKAAMAPGELSEKHKELIALGISVSQRCAGCIGFHVKALRRLVRFPQRGYAALKQSLAANLRKQWHLALRKVFGYFPQTIRFAVFRAFVQCDPSPTRG
jgi:AhpD family alkylhydroperoxidase